MVHSFVKLFWKLCRMYDYIQQNQTKERRWCIPPIAELYSRGGPPASKQSIYEAVGPSFPALPHRGRRLKTVMCKTQDPLALFERRVRAREEGGQTGVSPPRTTSLREPTPPAKVSSSSCYVLTKILDLRFYKDRPTSYVTMGGKVEQFRSAKWGV